MKTTPEQHNRIGLLVTGDLIFSTKITGTARALGMEMAVAASPAAAAEQLAAAAEQLAEGRTKYVEDGDFADKPVTVITHKDFANKAAAADKVLRF